MAAAPILEPDSAGDVLIAARESRRNADREEVRILQLAVQWAVMHPVDSIVEAATVPGTEGQLAIAGPGAPLVAEFCVAELAAALGMSTDAGRHYLGQAVELRYRLPDLYARVLAGKVPAWRARRIAEHTLPLTLEAAGWVDRKVAWCAHTLGPVQLDRTIDAALARYMPEEAERRRQAAAEERRFDIGLAEAGTRGTVRVDGVLDAADALDLEAAVAAGAKELADLGSAESLPVRRSQAVGEMARRDPTLDYGSGEPVVESSMSLTGRPAGVEVHHQSHQPHLQRLPSQVRERSGVRASKPPHGRRAATTRGTGRGVVIHVHLTETALLGADPVGRCGNTAAPVLTEQIRAWCGTAAEITVKPVIDLSGHDPVDRYERPGRHEEQVELRDGHCVFPHCRRPAQKCDKDHVLPWPDGPTCPCNLAPLCRRHHRHKTHGGWTYTTPEPGTYLWRSPHGYRYRVDPIGTLDISAEPPDE